MRFGCIFRPNFQNLTKNLTKLFSPVALVDRDPEEFQFLVLIWLHGLHIGMAHRLADREGVTALFLNGDVAPGSGSTSLTMRNGGISELVAGARSALRGHS